MMNDMDMQDVIISITGIQQHRSGLPEKVELVTTGQYGYENGESRLTYVDRGLAGRKDSRTTFTVTPMGVTLVREGDATPHIEFREGRRDFYLCQTPFGSATMNVDTKRVVTLLDEHGGTMELDYSLGFNYAPVGRNQFKINVREKKHG